MMELTEAQQQALDQQGNELLRLVDPRTQRAYVLVSAEAYERVQSLLEDDLDMRQVAILVERAMREDDAGDPTLAYYQQQYGRNP
jgi:hypothetical protein